MRTAGLAGLVVVLTLSAPAARAPLGRGQSAGGRATTLPIILAIEDARAPTRDDLAVLLQALKGDLRNHAMRALGRLQRRDVITALLPLLSLQTSRGAAATALMLSLRGEPLGGVPQGQQEQAVLDAMLAAGAAELSRPMPESLDEVALSLSRLPYERAEPFKAAETFLRHALEKPFPSLEDRPQIAAARSLEALARLNRKIAALDDETVSRLEMLARTINPKRMSQQRNALAALIAAQRVDEDTLTMALKAPEPETRRLAMIALTGSGSTITDDARVGLIRPSLQDSSFMVRLEAVRAWTRRGVRDHGCQPLADALRDPSLHVVLAAIDALGDQCRDDVSVTERVLYEAQTPPAASRWQRQAHAFVALAKRDKERAAIGMMTFATHNVWQVRMYAARAAAIVDDAAVLERLAADPDDNVAETALPPLRRLLGSDSDAAFVAALRRTNRSTGRPEPSRPYQIVRTAARALDNARPTPELLAALTGALERISAEHCETSRDARLALIERIGLLGSAAQVSALTPLLRDDDPIVAGAAAALITTWTGKRTEIEPPARTVARPVSEADLGGSSAVLFEMDNGRTFTVIPQLSAPLTGQRFLEAVRRGYYNRLTFHRVVANFVIQGGSPNANEYCGACPFMRDELGGAHARGVLGISTRGRDTGDAQIFVNLVDNARLDFDYTAFANVCGDGMNVVDEIQEGDRIVSARVVPRPNSCGL